MTEQSTVSGKPEVLIVDDTEALYRTAAREFRRCASEAVAARGRFSVALSGGNTPRGLYTLLAQECQKDIPWDKTFVFFGDERCVPSDHPDSNYRMAYESLLSQVGIPEGNVFRVHAELAAGSAADDYDRRLREFFGSVAAFPRFDLALLGIGDDGHIASLFPGSVALQEQSRWVVANWVEKFQTFRITFTFPVLNHAAEVLFLVSGDGKAQVLREIFSSPSSGYPAQAVKPANGRLLWLMDKSAARWLALKKKTPCLDKGDNVW